MKHISMSLDRPMCQTSIQTHNTFSLHQHRYFAHSCRTIHKVSYCFVDINWLMGILVHKFFEHPIQNSPSDILSHTFYLVDRHKSSMDIIRRIDLWSHLQRSFPYMKQHRLLSSRMHMYLKDNCLRNSLSCFIRTYLEWQDTLLRMLQM